ncbi:hypothetical protein ACV3O0_16405 [Clostridium perfringens]
MTRPLYTIIINENTLFYKAMYKQFIDISQITSEIHSVIKFNLLDEISIYYLFNGVGSELSNTTHT